MLHYLKIILNLIVKVVVLLYRGVVCDSNDKWKIRKDEEGKLGFQFFSNGKK